MLRAFHLFGDVLSVVCCETVQLYTVLQLLNLKCFIGLPENGMGKLFYS